MAGPPQMTDMIEARFAAISGHAPAGTGAGHGRVNLIGEHTDYNEGFVMPCILHHGTRIAVSLRDDTLVHGHSDAFGADRVPLDAVPAGHWLTYVAGAVAMAGEAGAPRCGLNLLVESSLPSGAGVSSSAALGVALLKALFAAHDMDCPPAPDLARLAQRIEHEFIGLKCGIMDHMVCAVGAPTAAMQLDCRDLSYQLTALPPDHVFLVIHSGSGRKLSEGLYNQRVAECAEAAADIGVASLRDATLSDLTSLGDTVAARRARHVISENDRVVAAGKALGGGDIAAFGRLMNDSHASLANDYEVSSDRLDRLVAVARGSGALGARLTGAGFGGCVVVLARAARADAILQAILADCDGAWLVDRIGF